MVGWKPPYRHWRVRSSLDSIIYLGYLSDYLIIIFFTYNRAFPSLMDSDEVSGPAGSYLKHIRQYLYLDESNQSCLFYCSIDRKSWLPNSKETRWSEKQRRHIFLRPSLSLTFIIHPSQLAFFYFDEADFPLLINSFSELILVNIPQSLSMTWKTSEFIDIEWSLMAGPLLWFFNWHRGGIPEHFSNCNPS